MYFDRINETICALATSSGSSIGIIRISGRDSFKIASSLCNVKSFEHMKARMVKIKHHGKTLEKCLLLPFKCPESFTGEDVVEFHVHGSNMNAGDIMSILIEKGAVAALRGEFSFRAVMNSKMELSQAFALNTLITSSNPVSIELSRKAAFEDRSLKKLFLLLDEWERFFVLTTAIVDFPDQVENELPAQKLSELAEKTEKYLSETLENSALLEKTGSFSVLIAGKPNSGKSSLFNILINKDRAIVSNDAGTTRDYISDSFNVKGFNVQIIDSAGLRDGLSEIEQQGINKSRKLIKHADLLLLVFDGSEPFEAEDFKILSETSIYPRILIVNKIDKNYSAVLPEEFKNALKISCLKEKGINTIIEAVSEQIKKHMPDNNRDLFFSTWQKDLSTETLERM
ncbi:MAG TPA: tRNA uridine-5-carboxymethylaminomethyl(34) synthesis GTPase MnmE, partial [bacterium]|nr:tRNA uridine-5-carboxymethylaminomethyl(34) synthesis GTPase MnmE [bacterium]